MKLISKGLKLFKTDFMRLELVDRCLIVFMVILMIQIATNLFWYRIETVPNDVDVIVRTTAASIFGYFLSSNFTRNALPKNNCPEDAEKVKKNARINKQQIMIVFVFGLVSLVLLIIARNFFYMNPIMHTTIAQLRDFVSGSVGFLVGSPCTNNKRSTKI